jgi:hypothetical protein
MKRFIFVLAALALIAGAAALDRNIVTTLSFAIIIVFGTVGAWMIVLAEEAAAECGYTMIF